MLKIIGSSDGSEKPRITPISQTTISVEDRRIKTLNLFEMRVLKNIFMAIKNTKINEEIKIEPKN
jgi:hypothetical protein